MKIMYDCANYIMLVEITTAYKLGIIKQLCTPCFEMWTFYWEKDTIVKKNILPNSAHFFALLYWSIQCN